MDRKNFGRICFILAIVFSVAAVKGMMMGDFGLVLIVPALVAITLIVVGTSHLKKTA